jgi:hypothetical protein
LEKIFQQAVQAGQTTAEIPTAEEYARLRSQYIRAGNGTPPPGAEPE